ncbi:NADPH-dependent F420 reductase [Nostocoides sp.]
MKVGLLGTGNLATALGRAWAAKAHAITVTGRSREHAAAAIEKIGFPGVTTVPPDRFAEQADVVVVAVSWDGLTEALTLVGGPDGSLSDKTVIDCTNAVDSATGRLIPSAGSAADVVAAAALGANVVKALHLFSGATWPYIGDPGSSPVVALSGDDATALDTTAELVHDLGARTAVLGGLATARQAEETAAFVMRIVASGANPRFAIPDVRR